MKKIAICFGGISPEHEVSIITGLQILENIDMSAFQPYVIYISQTGEFFYLPNLSNRSGFLHSPKKVVSFGRDEKGGFIQTSGLLANKVYIDAAYLAFHGGNGESGQLEGLLDSCGIAHTGHDVFTSAVSMNKQVTKDLVSLVGVPTIPGISVTSDEIVTDVKKVTKRIVDSVKLPVIVKPVHLGSSIGVTPCTTSVSLTKALLVASQIDREILVEKLMTDFVEYNCAVRSKDGKIEVSEIEKPLKKDEILSFADKYERGGGKKTGGMASLIRELPAKITPNLKKEIQENATLAYKAVRATGMLRCDFLYTKNKLYLVELNPIPGSVAFYLWEATGITFTDQITDALNEAFRVFNKVNTQTLQYKTDIVKNFVNAR